MFVFMVLCLFCNSIICFAGSKITTEYDEEDNKIYQEYEQLFGLGSAGKTDLIADFTYKKNYKFNKNFDVVTKTCKPSDFIFIMFWDYKDELKYMKNEIVLTELKTGKVISVPVDFNRSPYSDSRGTGYTLSGGLAPRDIPEFVDLVLSSKPLKISFKFSVPPAKGVEKYLAFNFEGETLEQVKSVLNYDLYSDPSQTENIKKAVAAIPAN